MRGRASNSTESNNPIVESRSPLASPKKMIPTTTRRAFLAVPNT